MINQPNPNDGKNYQNENKNQPETGIKQIGRFITGKASGNNPEDSGKNPKEPIQISLEYEEIEEKELQIHFQILRQWLIKYNTFEYDTQSIGKLRDYNVEDINIILNHKTNFTRIKLFIDYLELELKCPNFAKSLRNNFVMYTKYLNSLSRKILLTNKKIQNDTSVFTDFILLNYPFILNQISKNEMLEIVKKRKDIVCFTKCTVVKVKEPIFLLWCKKVQPTCNCEISTKIKPQRYFDILKKNIKNCQNFNQNEFCQKCGKPFFHDSKSDIYIDCQEVEVIIYSDSPSLVPTHITLWAFPNLINSVHVGDCITINAFYIRDKVECFEKNFEYGSFIALNFNICFTPIQLLSSSNFILQNTQVETVNDFIKKRYNNENDSNIKEINKEEISKYLNSLQFQRDLNNNFYKFLIQNYIFYRKKELINFNSSFDNEDSCYSNPFPLLSENYFPFLNIILDLSICQRDYFNHNSKISFLKDNNANYLIEIENLSQSINAHKNDLFSNAILTNSHNLVFKTKIFNRNNYNTHQMNFNDLDDIKSQKENDFKKYFRLCKQMVDTNNKCTSDLLKKALNLFLIFDNTNSDPIFNSMLKYAKSLYKSSLIIMYPFFNTTNKNFDKENMLNFLYQANNKIVLISDIDSLSKNEIEIINSFMQNDLISINGELRESNLSITFWFCCNCLKLYENSNKKKNNKVISIPQDSGLNLQQFTIKGFENILNNCDIAINFSKRNVKLTSNIDIINEKNFSNFIKDINTPLYSNDMLLNLFYEFQSINSKIQFSCNEKHKSISEEFNNSTYASHLIEEYFIKKRNLINKITFDDFFSLLRIAMLMSILRANYENRKITLPTTISSINFFDAIIGIILYEEVCGIKYGIESKSFGFMSTKILFSDYQLYIGNAVTEIENQGRLEAKLNAFQNKVFQIPVSKKNKGRISNFGNSNINEKKDQNCILCKEINKINYGREDISEFLAKLNEFVYANNSEQK